MVYEEILVGLMVAVVVLLGLLLYRVSRLGPKVLEARAREIEMRFKDMRLETSSLEERLNVLGKAIVGIRVAGGDHRRVRVHPVTKDAA